MQQEAPDTIVVIRLKFDFHVEAGLQIRNRVRRRTSEEGKKSHRKRSWKFSPFAPSSISPRREAR